ncbi:MAG: DUF1576 domain-containing protein [Clostridia bacterium]|nr:DUF1576 domain-containing protein [Clostridia bacterium]
METKNNTSKVLYLFFLAFSLAMIVAGFCTGPVDAMFKGFGAILTSPQSLTVDSLAVGGLNGGLFHAGMLGLIAILILKFAKVEASGLTVGVFFLTVGFSFFGKNCLNIWPIVLGVWVYARVKKEPFTKHAHFALFGTALAPIVSEMLFNRFLSIPLPLGIFLAIVVGGLFGFLIPPVSAHAATMHQGHNLFNVGLSAGILAMLFAAIYKNAVLKPLGIEFTTNSIVSDGFNSFFLVFLGAIFVACAIVGLILNKGFKGYGTLLMRTGHGCDFTKLDGVGNVLINYGFLGLMALAYFTAVGAKLTGPAVGALLCLTCWAGNGSHPRNVLPIMVGYVLVGLITGTPLNTAGWVIGLCFASGMSPVSGRWGVIWGVVAGALHACLVLNTAAFHLGFNVYNGGFTSGLVTMAMVPVLNALCKDIPTKQAEKLAGQAADA